MGIKIQGSSGSNEKYGHSHFNDEYIEARAAAKKQRWQERLARIAKMVVKSLRVKKKINRDLKMRMSDMPRGYGKFGRKVFRANAKAATSSVGNLGPSAVCSRMMTESGGSVWPRRDRRLRYYNGPIHDHSRKSTVKKKRPKAWWQIKKKKKAQ